MKPAMTAQNRKRLSQTSNIHWVKYRVLPGFILRARLLIRQRSPRAELDETYLKNDLRKSIISQAKNNANHVKHVKVEARALKTVLHVSLKVLLHPDPRLPLPKPYMTRTKLARHKALIQSP